jgi:hypothetical protein
MSLGQLSCLDSHSGPFSHSCVDSFTLPPRLPIFFGIHISPMDVCLLLDLLHSISNVLDCLYSPPPFNQCKATVLSSQPCTSLTGNPSNACFTLCTKLHAMCADTNFCLGIVSCCFANRGFAATRP